MLKAIAAKLIARNEKRLGVPLDYVHTIARMNTGLLMRYGKIFGFLDPVKHVPAQAYHVARLRGALAADCGTCVQTEINLAEQAGLDGATVRQVLSGNYATLPEPVAQTARLADAVVGRREDDAEARAAIIAAYGEAGLIELSFAMNGAALLPGIKRAMGYATACDLEVMRIKGRSA
ncbi:MAG: hypothetical protein AAFO61_12850 [Pseudomonadota bacterium]